MHFLFSFLTPSVSQTFRPLHVSDSLCRLELENLIISCNTSASVSRPVGVCVCVCLLLLLRPLTTSPCLPCPRSSDRTVFPGRLRPVLPHEDQLHVRPGEEGDNGDVRLHRLRVAEGQRRGHRDAFLLLSAGAA